MMATLLELWQNLQSAPRSTGGGYRLQLADAGLKLRVYAGIQETDSSPALLIELPVSLRPADLLKVTTRSFEAMVAELPGLPVGHRALILHLTDAEFGDLFAMLGEDVRRAVQAAGSAEAAFRSVVRTIDRWRRFVERGRRSLTDEEVHGLIGELIVLARCAAKFGIGAAVDSWRGPAGSLRDFELPDCTVEVKTYQSDAGASVRINDPQQLDNVAPRPVFLTAVRLSKVQTSGLNLNDIVQRARSLAAADPGVAEQLDTLIGQYGYMDAQAAMYQDRFVVGPVLTYKVDPAFPRIRNEAVPAGVVNVQFSLLLSALASFQVDSDRVIGPAAGELEAG